MALGTAIRHLRKGDWSKAHGLVQNDEHVLRNALEKIVSHDHERDAGGAQVLLRPRVDQRVLADVDRAAEDIGGRVAHEGRRPRRGLSGRRRGSSRWM